jgi:hypothetical protein
MKKIRRKIKRTLFLGRETGVMSGWMYYMFFKNIFKKVLKN